MLFLFPFVVFAYNSDIFLLNYEWKYVYSTLYLICILYYFYLSMKIRKNLVKTQNESNSNSIIDTKIYEETQEQKENQLSLTFVYQNDNRKFLIIDFIAKFYLTIVLILKFLFSSLTFTQTFYFIISNILPLLLISITFPQIRSFDDQTIKNIPKPHLDIPIISKFF